VGESCTFPGRQFQGFGFEQFKLISQA
jgi:hypothetical protein